MNTIGIITLCFLFLVLFYFVYLLRRNFQVRNFLLENVSKLNYSLEYLSKLYSKLLFFRFKKLTKENYSHLLDESKD